MYKGRLFGTDVAVKILEKKKKKPADAKPDASLSDERMPPLQPVNTNTNTHTNGPEALQGGIEAMMRRAEEGFEKEKEKEKQAAKESQSHSQSHRGSEKDSSCGSQNEVIRYEIGMMSEINHPNILKFLGTCQSRDLGQCIIVEYIDGGRLT